MISIFSFCLEILFVSIMCSQKVADFDGLGDKRFAKGVQDIKKTISP